MGALPRAIALWSFIVYPSMTNDGSEGYKYRRFRLNPAEFIWVHIFFSIRGGSQKGIVLTIGGKKSHHTVN